MIKVSAYLPLKAHSQRVKNKNIKLFCGEPLFTHILRTLHKLDWVSEIIINTDSPEIEATANQYSSKVLLVRRLAEVSGDHVTMNALLRTDLHRFKESLILQTHATNPLVSCNQLTLAYNRFISSLENHDSLYSVNKHQSRFYDSKLIPLNHEPKKLVSTQDLDPIYEENSCFYFFSKDSFAKSQHRIGLYPQVHISPKIESVDIDTQEDFEMAEVIFRFLNYLEP